MFAGTCRHPIVSSSLGVRALIYLNVFGCPAFFAAEAERSFARARRTAIRRARPTG